MSQLEKLTFYLPNLDVMYEDFDRAGVWWIVAAILGFVSGPLSVLISLLAISPIAVGGNVAVTFLGFIVFLSISIGGFFIIIAFNYTTNLRYLDKNLVRGAKIGIFSKVLEIASFLVIPLGSLVFISFLIGLGFLMLISGFLLEVFATIFLIMGFYKVGSMADDTLLRIGSILLILSFLLGGIIIGISLRNIADEISLLRLRKINWDEINQKINEKLSSGETLYLTHTAISMGINPLILNLKIREWMINKKLNGFLFRNFIIPETLK